MGFFRKKNGRERNGDKITIDSVSKQIGSIEFFQFGGYVKLLGIKVPSFV